ncbi:MAG: hypothetical protein IKB25_11170 [Lentisphaeria bacterium]|nr:hypothetical protein [Lentisphaeria bacterium]
MTPAEVMALFKENGRRTVFIGTEKAGVIVALDQEGRLFYVYNGEVVSRVNDEAIKGITNRSGYLNPGGDGLWPAPEGTCFGYEYATGNWRVPPSLTNARFMVLEQSANSVTIEAEIDLANASMKAIPTIFRRTITVSEENGKAVVIQKEQIEYIGAATLNADEALLAPWSLCQFDTPKGTYARFQAGLPIRNFYGESAEFRVEENGIAKMYNTEKQRWQVALNKDYEWIELILPAKNLKVRRTAEALPAGQNYIDIADAPVDRKPDGDPVKYSFYSDPSGFMEIEAAGGCTFPLTPGTVLEVVIRTELSAAE